MARQRSGSRHIKSLLHVLLVVLADLVPQVHGRPAGRSRRPEKRVALDSFLHADKGGFFPGDGSSLAHAKDELARLGVDAELFPFRDSSPRDYGGFQSGGQLSDFITASVLFELGLIGLAERGFGTAQDQPMPGPESEFVYTAGLSQPIGKFEDVVGTLDSDVGVFGWHDSNGSETQETEEFRPIAAKALARSVSPEDRDCETILTKSCTADTECLCYGFYHCSQNRCKDNQSATEAEIFSEEWHEKPADTQGLTGRR